MKRRVGSVVIRIAVWKTPAALRTAENASRQGRLLA